MKKLGALLALALARHAHAAACCGGSSVAPAILTGDDRAQVTISASESRVIGDAFSSGLPVFRADGDDEQAQALRLDGAFLLTDRWQAGMSIPFVRRSRATPGMSASASGLSDVGLSVAYEILPEWEYSAWKPRGFAFAEGLIPLGGSIYQATLSPDNLGMDARGRGFYALGAGAVFLKTWGDWDASLITEAHRSFSRSVSSTEGELTLKPGWGGTAGISGGLSFRALPLRVGLGLSPLFEQGVDIQGAPSSDSQLVWNSTVSLGWQVGHDSTLSALFTDQTWIGPASNVALSRTLAILFQQRWER